MVRTTIDGAHNKECYYVCTAADESVEEEASEYFRILLQDAETFYYRIDDLSALPRFIRRAPIAALSVYAPIGYQIPDHEEASVDWKGEAESIPGTWRGYYHMLRVDEDVRAFLLARWFAFGTGKIRFKAQNARGNADEIPGFDFDGLEDYILKDRDGSDMVYANQREGYLAIRRDIYEKLLPIFFERLKRDPKYAETGAPLEGMTAAERRDLYLLLRLVSGGYHGADREEGVSDSRFFYRIICKEAFEAYRDSDVTKYLTAEYRGSASLDRFTRMDLFARDVYYLLDLLEVLYYREICDLI